MAVNTANTILKSSTTESGTYTKLVDIISYPDLGGSPSMLDTTDLSALRYKTNIQGLQEMPELTFECNYDKTAYKALSAMIGTVHWFKLEFGDSGEDGIFQWSGEVSVSVDGGGVDEVRKMTLVLSSATEIEEISI